VLLYTQVTPRSGTDKDTLQNLLETGECVVNIANSDVLEKMNMTSASLEATASEFDFAEVEQCPSQTVAPASVKASPVRYECTLREVICISDLPTGGSVVLLDVQCIYVRDDLYINHRIDQKLVDSVGKMGGDAFSLTSNTLELKRP
jgi:flavin reductase (DIM6/NTAB) family NADH-FMN oxidoreductase RutF